MFNITRREADARTRYSTLENDLLRTHGPKYASYFGDGSGRDTYVVTDNGGLLNKEKRGMTRRPFKNTLVNRDSSPLKPVMPVSYHSDGTGRDSYVVSNAGGLVHDFHGSSRSDVNFVASLRQQLTRVMPTKVLPADITNYIGWQDPRTKRTLIENAKKVGEVTTRLCVLSPDNRRQPLSPQLLSPKVS